jgi:hypothetical protein
LRAKRSNLDCILINNCGIAASQQRLLAMTFREFFSSLLGHLGVYQDNLTMETSGSNNHAALIFLFLRLLFFFAQYLVHSGKVLLAEPLPDRQREEFLRGIRRGHGNTVLVCGFRGQLEIFIHPLEVKIRIEGA